ncbi:MAG: hypothetical protein R2764_00110 [Bacteroidales bacterium]
MDNATTLKIVPNTSSLNQLKEAVEYARNSGKEKPYIVVLFHSYDFIESSDNRGNYTLSNFLDLLDWTASQKDIKTKTIKEVAGTTNDFESERYAINIKIVNFNILLPPFMRPADTGVYIDRSDLTNITFRFVLFYVVIIIFSLIIALLINKVILSRLGILKPVLKYGITILLVLAIGYTFTTELAGFKVLIIDAILLGFAAGIWINDYCKHRKKFK